MQPEGRAGKGERGRTGGSRDRRAAFPGSVSSFPVHPHPQTRARDVSHFDPSWCARINAHHHAPEPSPAPPAGTGAAAEPVPPSPRRSPFELREIPREHTCELCGTVMYDHNCKIVCPNCGYKRDCSDP